MPAPGRAPAMRRRPSDNPVELSTGRDRGLGGPRPGRKRGPGVVTTHEAAGEGPRRVRGWNAEVIGHSLVVITLREFA